MIEESSKKVHKSTIARLMKSCGAKYVLDKSRFIVQTLWAARWRLQFSIEWLNKLGETEWLKVTTLYTKNPIELTCHASFLQMKRNSACSMSHIIVMRF